MMVTVLAVTPGWATAVDVAGGHAFVADRDVGVHVIDVSRPADPGPAGLLETPDGVHDVQVVGSTAFAAAGDAGLLVARVRNLSRAIHLPAVFRHDYAP